MTLPLTSPFSSRAGLTKAALDQLVGSINAGSFGFFSTSNNNAAVTLTTAGVDKAGSATLQIPPTPVFRRYLAIAVARFVPLAQANPVAGRFQIQVGYNTGAAVDVTSVNKVGQSFTQYLTPLAGGAANSSSGIAAGTVTTSSTLSTWVYGVVQRTSAGTSSDTADFHQLLLIDIGGS